MARVVVLLLTLLIIVIAPGAGRAEPIVGRASVIDGDTLEIRGLRIRLKGIDAPESGQLCRLRGRKYWCGRLAAFALADAVRDRTVACAPMGRDRYRRVIAVCRAGGVDLNAWMVSEGWALAYRRYSEDYVAAEATAEQARRGMWRGPFVAPWDWRRGKRLASLKRASASPPRRAPARCRIKGNIARNGERIYHVPGGEYYARTRITPSKGERYFCSEAEAMAAGWRRSLR